MPKDNAIEPKLRHYKHSKNSWHGSFSIVPEQEKQLFDFIQDIEARYQCESSNETHKLELDRLCRTLVTDNMLAAQPRKAQAPVHLKSCSSRPYSNAIMGALANACAEFDLALCAKAVTAIEEHISLHVARELSCKFDKYILCALCER